jgi:hypothetical protein
LEVLPDDLKTVFSKSWDLNPRPILMEQAIPIGIASTARIAALHGRCKLGTPIGLSWRRLTVVCNE